MKKTVSALMIAVSAAAFAANANANNMEFKPYVGIDYNHVRDNVKHVRPYYNSASINVGSMYNKYFGTELFYQYSAEYRKLVDASGDGRLKSDFQAYGIDLMGYLPYCDVYNFIGTVGYGQYRFDSKFGGAHGTLRDHGDGYRIGAGAMYDLNSNMSVRGLVRYIEFDKIDGNDHAIEYSLGLRYSF
ncbi:MAG: porin family protein [Lactobacillaceae bacterium]|jgi:opacity protein-like surface antigen|nr:porin family protein [Lactobacillaceae bacterium]